MTINAREKIKQSFRQLYVTKNIDKITITELTRQAGVNRKTYYRYFYSLDEVLAAVEENLTVDLRHELASFTTFNIRNFILVLNKLTKKNHHFYTVLLKNNQNPHFLNQAKDILNQELGNKLKVDLHNAMVDLKLEYISDGIINLYAYWANSPSRCSN